MLTGIDRSTRGHDGDWVLIQSEHTATPAQRMSIPANMKMQQLHGPLLSETRRAIGRLR